MFAAQRMGYGNLLCSALAAIAVGALTAPQVFGDRLPVSAKLNGGTSWTCTSGSSTDCDSTNGGYVQVQPGASIAVLFTVTTTGSGTSDDWFGTGWTVVGGSSSGCDDFEPDHASAGTFTESWSITAPSAEGIYDLDLHARRNDGCSQGGCGCMTLKRGIIVKKIPNPPQEESCGFDMVLVLDSSGSIDNTELGQMKDAFEAFVAAFLPETPTKMAVVDFDTSAAVIQGFTDNQTALNAAVNAPTSGGATNWDDAMYEARSLLPHRPDKPDLIVFASDGNPNRRGGHTALGHSNSVATVSEAQALAWAVAEADAAKTAGARIITLGIGTDLDPQSMVLISSPDALITSNFSTLAADLAELATQLCGGTVTVHKVLDADGKLNTTGDQTNGPGWTFTADVVPPDSATPSSGQTDSGGMLNFDLDLGNDNEAHLDIIETVQPGYVLLDASCEESGYEVGTPEGNAVNKIPVGPQDIVSCTFYNTSNAGACCDLLKEICTDGVVEKECISDGLIYGGDGSTCDTLSPPCHCENDSGCSSCIAKTGAGSRHVEIKLVSAVFNGTNTTFTYRVCQGSASQDLSHWALGLSEACCNALVSASGGSHAGSSCSIDPTTHLFGLKYETNGGVPDCNGSTCAGGGSLFTVTLSGNIGTGCVKTANKIDGPPSSFYGCVQGPSCTACTNDAQCSDGVPCTNDDCNALGVCVHTPNNSKCSDGLFCTGQETCNAMTGCQDGPDPCSPPLLCNEGIDQCVSCLTDADCNDGLFCNGTEKCKNNVCHAGPNPCPPDNVACTTDSCDEATDTCVHTPVHSQCNDGNVCTDDICHPTLGCQNTNNNNLCNDGNQCTQFDRCVGGVCTGDQIDCSFLNDQCNVGVCNMSTGMCEAQPANEGSPCEDGLFCSVGKTCVAGSCTGAQPRDCSDGITCTLDSCDEEANVCRHKPNDDLCNNNQFCDGVETCDADFGCVAGTNPCDDKVPCTIDTCDEAADQCVFTPDDGQCQDDVFCNGVEVCDPEVGCQAGPNPCPDDGVPCTNDFCDETNDTCVHEPNNANCANGLFCDGMESCDAVLGCQDGPDPCPVKCDEAGDRCVECLTDAQCDDGLFCNGAESCNLVTGNCQAGANPCPPDKVACTVDSCDEAANQCLHVPDDSACQNGLFCDGMEVCHPTLGCQDGADPCPIKCDESGDRCVECLTNAQCDDGNFCNGAETCNTVTGLCQTGSNPCPADNVACTIDSCDEATDTCLHTPNDAFCQNGLFCDGIEGCHPTLGCKDGDDPCAIKCDEAGDRCVKCLTDDQCDDGLFCNGLETCDTVIGDCVDGPSPCPPDNVACTIDSCDEAADACLHTPNHDACQNGVFCDGVEVCDPAVGCVDGADPCTLPLKCDEPGDRCVDCLTDAQCDDGLFCNGLETCDEAAGVCQPGTDPCPPDSVDCTVDVCDEAANQCLHIPDDSFCQNGLFCDGMEVCHPTLGCQDSPDPCPIKCDELGDRCVDCLTDTQCDDGLFCNGLETCDTVTGTCQPGTSPCPPDTVPCTIDVCDEAADQCLHIPDDSACQNGLFCDGMEVCYPTLGCQDGPDPCPIKCDEVGDRCVECLTDMQCDDGLFCNGLETCDEVAGVCVPGSNPCPPDNVACTIDLCDEAADACLHIPDNSACQNGQFCDGMEVCDPLLGCQDGPDPCPIKCDEVGDRCVECLTDMQCDDGLFCNGLETCDEVAGVCVPGSNPCPPDNVACTIDGCSEATDMCTHKPDGSVCNDNNECTDDVCDPVLGCQNTPRPAGTLCGNATPQGPCDNSDVCDGMGNCIPNLKPPATECRPSGGACDVAEFCTGSSADCPPDAFQPPILCRASAGACDVAEFCTGSSPNCPDDVFLPPSTECRGASDVCDTPEFCPGNGPACPRDGFAGQGTVCRAANGECDAVETCTGVSAACPPDGFAPPMLCRASAGPCDQEELCTGSGPNCPPDSFLPNGTTCRMSAGVCDVTEVCTGSSANCPPDGFQPGTTTCRAAADVCDVAELCTGSSANCPPDAFQPSTTICRASAGVCDVAETCTGSSTPCPPNGFQPNTVVCREEAGVCDAEERCTGSSADCPPDVSDPPGTPCTSDGDECTDDACDAAGQCAHPESGECGACCLGVDECIDGVGQLTCQSQQGVFLGPGTSCAAQGDTCSALTLIPTVSQWGLLVLTLLLLTAGKLYFRFRSVSAGVR